MSDHTAVPHSTENSVFKIVAETIETFSNRTLYAIIVFGLTLVAVELFLFWIIEDFKWEFHTKFILGLVIWGYILASKLRMFLVSVPEVTGLLTVNSYTGKLTPYGTGLHIIYPWEQVKEGNYINMRIITMEVEETYPSLDGSLMLVKWSFQYKVMLKLLARYISIGDADIKKGMRDIGSSALSVKIALTPADECKSKQKDMEEELRKAIEEHEPTPEELYGIELKKVAVADMDYEASVQKARAAKDIAARTRKIAEAIKLDDNSISMKEAMNMALIVNGNITKQVFEVEGAGAALEALLNFFRSKNK